MRGGLTIDVYIPKGILHEPGWLSRFFWFIGGNPAVFLPVVTLAVMFLCGGTVAAIPTPASRSRRCTSRRREFSCRSRDLARRQHSSPGYYIDHCRSCGAGFLKIEETDEKGLLFHNKDYIFHLLQADAAVGWREPGASRTRDDGRIFSREACSRYAPLESEESLLHYGPGNSGRHHVSAETERHLHARSRIGEWLQHCSGWWHSHVFRGLQFFHVADFLSSIPVLIVSLLISAAIWWLFARVMTAKTLKGVAHSYRRPRISGIYEPRRSRPVEDHASGYVRKVSSIRHGAGSGASLGTGFRGHRERSADLVCRPGLCIRNDFQSAAVFKFHAWHGDGYASSVRLGAAS